MEQAGGNTSRSIIQEQSYQGSSGYSSSNQFGGNSQYSATTPYQGGATSYGGDRTHYSSNVGGDNRGQYGGTQNSGQYGGNINQGQYSGNMNLNQGQSFGAQSQYSSQRGQQGGQ